MPTSFEELFRAEKEHKEIVYTTFDTMRNEARKTVNASKAYVQSGAFDDQDAFVPYGKIDEAIRKWQRVEKLVQKLHRKPYFAHIELKEKGYEDVEHFYLSDCESLDCPVNIGKHGLLIPFKLEKDRPFSVALFHLYQSKTADDIQYRGNDGSIIAFSPLLICDDEIENRELLNVMQLFPEQEILWVNADELLEQKLQENRRNPQLKNIIATLQRKQFKIIETDLSTSFIVQGCAGSGKSQCLLHRLFFLRDELSQDGWDKVLLLTPTQLFRNYSADLIKRYHLSNIADCSIAELYQTIMTRYDSRFRNRHYQFELTEEYLPDAYLQVVYSDETIRLIENEIEKAILSYTESACTVIGEKISSEINAVYISGLIRKLDEELNRFDEREAVLQQDPDYIEHRNHYEVAQKELEAAQKNYDRLTRELEQLNKEEEQLWEAILNFKDIKQEYFQWVAQRENRIASAYKAVSRFDNLLESSGRYEAPARFMQKLYALQDITSGETFTADEEYQKFLDEYYKQAASELSEITKTQTPERQVKSYAKRKGNIEKKISIIADDIEVLSLEQEQNEEWLRSKAADFEGEKSSRTLRRADMERAKHFLTRIESTVFEQEVWNALAPIKEKNGIQTLSIEEINGGHRRETRILYKSDLLFYLKIYLRLYPVADMTEYSLLCIDEGQDLHKADYDMLHQLFPHAVFNIFGDTEQVLHEDCGVSDWKNDTGVQRFFHLDINYRNAAGIVDFCNRQFGCDMKYLGKPLDSQIPVVLQTAGAVKSALQNKNVVVIVKDRKNYKELADMINDSNLFEFIDTNTVNTEGKKIPCYSIFAAKGLEFSKVIVYAAGMTVNQRIVACTRATEKLYYYE